MSELRDWRVSVLDRHGAAVKQMPLRRCTEGTAHYWGPKLARWEHGYLPSGWRVRVEVAEDRRRKGVQA